MDTLADSRSSRSVGRNEPWHAAPNHNTTETQQNLTEQNMPAPTFIASVDAQAVARRLMELQPGDLIHYSNLRLICPDRDLRGRHRWILTAARRIALRDGEMVFGVVKGVGLKRLTNEEVAAIPSSAIASTRRLVARSLRKKRVLRLRTARPTGTKGLQRRLLRSRHREAVHQTTNHQAHSGQRRATETVVRRDPETLSMNEA